MFSHTKPPAGTQINPLHPLSRGLVGCWLFNEGAGSLANDISGNKNHGRLTNMAPNVQGSAWGNGGLEFDETNDYVINSAFHNLFWGSSKLSVFAVANVDSLTGSRQIIVNQGEEHFKLRIDNTNNQLEVYVETTSGGALVYDSVPFTSDEWMYVGFTWDGSTVRLYKNSYEVGTPLNLGGTWKTSDKDSSDLRFGSQYNNVDFLGGKIAHAYIYNRALSAEEVAWSYREPYAMFEPAFNPALLYSAAPPTGAIMNQFQKANIGADLYNGVFA